MELGLPIEDRIEPHAFRPEDFNMDNPLVNEIYKSGIEIVTNLYAIRVMRMIPCMNILVIMRDEIGEVMKLRLTGELWWEGNMYVPSVNINIAFLKGIGYVPTGA